MHIPSCNLDQNGVPRIKACQLDQDGVPRIKACQLDEYSEDILKDFNAQVLKKPQPLNVEMVAEKGLNATLEIRPITPDQSILGVTVFCGGCIPVYDRDKGVLVPLNVCERTIVVEQGLLNRREPGRYNFTVAHEVGHLACHSDVRINTGMIHRLDSGSTVIMCRETANGIRTRRTPEEWLEWQADYFAGALLMPRKTFWMAVQDAMSRLGMFGGSLGLDIIRHDARARNQVILYVAGVFRTSQKATSIRLQELEAQRRIDQH